MGARLARVPVPRLRPPVRKRDRLRRGRKRAHRVERGSGNMGIYLFLKYWACQLDSFFLAADDVRRERTKRTVWSFVILESLK